MAPFSSRRTAPTWPPLKESYQRLGEEDGLQLITSGTGPPESSRFDASPTPRHTMFEQPTSKWWQGWRGGAKVAFFSAAAVLFLNVVLLLIMVLGFPKMDGMSMIYLGSCTTSERINTGVHFGVNVLSTALLAGSNYCMQILSAPSRKDVDLAHANGKWLDIGIASLRNLRILRKQKVILWWLLAASSIPLHLFYNSVFFTAIATHDYNVLYATPDFVDGAAYNKTKFPDSNWRNVTNLQERASSFERLTNEECIQAYAVDFVTDRKDVIAIIRDTLPSNTSSVQNATTNQTPSSESIGNFNAFAWICDDPSTPVQTDSKNNTKCSRMTDKLALVANNEWRSGGFDIDHCLSEPIQADCHVHFSPQIMAPVLFFNIIKAAVIAYVAFFLKDKPLVTLGDAIESFSLRPDLTTQGMCLATHEMIEHQWTRGYVPQPIRYDGQRRRWYQSLSWKQWLTFGVVFGIAVAAVFAGIGIGIANIEPSTLANAWSLGIGKVRTQNLIMGIQADSLGANAVLISALVANSPQTVFSFIYLIYNNVFTTMVLSNEWDRFSIKSGTGRTLRVSEPQGDQRSTYFLQIPYRYAIVMLTTSGVLHWLVSQSLFLANIAVVPLDGVTPRTDEITTCSYSVKAMILVLVVGVVMFIWLFGNGLRRFSGGMPFVGSNSAAISAACHTEYSLRCEREAMVLKPLRWGVTDYGGNRKSIRKTPTEFEVGPPTGSDAESVETLRYYTKREARYDEGPMSDEDGFMQTVGHCTFTDGRVAKPVNGRLYA